MRIVYTASGFFLKGVVYGQMIVCTYDFGTWQCTGKQNDGDQQEGEPWQKMLHGLIMSEYGIA